MPLYLNNRLTCRRLLLAVEGDFSVLGLIPVICGTFRSTLGILTSPQHGSFWLAASLILHIRMDWTASMEDDPSVTPHGLKLEPISRESGEEPTAKTKGVPAPKRRCVSTACIPCRRRKSKVDIIITHRFLSTWKLTTLLSSAMEASPVALPVPLFITRPVFHSLSAFNQRPDTNQSRRV